MPRVAASATKRRKSLSAVSALPSEDDWVVEPSSDSLSLPRPQLLRSVPPQRGCQKLLRSRALSLLRGGRGLD